jgi:hypothetical protein
MSKPIQTPNQRVFGDSCAVVCSVQRDATKALGALAEVVPGLPAGLHYNSSAARGELVTDVTTNDVFYGAFINLPINTLSGRTSLGEMQANQSTVEVVGRIRVRQARYQNSQGGESYINPFMGTAPTKANIGTLVDAVEVAGSGGEGINPFAVTIMKWQLNGGSGNGFNEVAVITDVSDDGTEVELRMFDKYTAYAALA